MVNDRPQRAPTPAVTVPPRLRGAAPSAELASQGWDQHCPGARPWAQAYADDPVHSTSRRAQVDIAAVEAAVAGIPHMTVAQARRMTRFILEHECRDVLELGFRHGVSTCYMAAAVDELGQGSVVTIDLDSARHASPNIDELLGRLGLSSHVTRYYEENGYLWRLMKLLENDPTPRFDLVYVDGAHSWAVDGYAFFLADRLLRTGGWMIFDDLDWSYAESLSLRDTPAVRAMTEEYRTAHQVRKVYELLVRTQVGYGEYREEAGWGYARKLFDPGADLNRLNTQIERLRAESGRLRARVHRMKTSTSWRVTAPMRAVSRVLKRG